MNFYEATVTFRKKQTQEVDEDRSLFVKEGSKKTCEELRETFCELNKRLGATCDCEEAYTIFSGRRRKVVQASSSR